VEYIPIRDYYHRHTRSIFWEIQDIVTFGNHPVFRWLCGWLMPPHISVLKRTQTEEIRRLYELHHVVQDMLVPASQLEATLLQSKAEFDVFPLWICPMRIFPEDTGFVSPSSKGEEMYVDVGIYGVPKVSPPPTKSLTHICSCWRLVRPRNLLQSTAVTNIFSLQLAKGFNLPLLLSPPGPPPHLSIKTTKPAHLTAMTFHSY